MANDVQNLVRVCFPCKGLPSEPQRQLTNTASAGSIVWIDPKNFWEHDRVSQLDTGPSRLVMEQISLQNA